MIEQIELEGKTRYLAHFDAQIHMPVNAEMLAYYEDMGTIYRYTINYSSDFDIHSVEIPDFIQEAVKNNRNRHQTEWVMRTNRNYSKYSWMGRASSMFISRNYNQPPGQFNIDFFSEDQAHLWSGDPIMHDYLRDHFSNYEGYPNIRPANKNCAAGCRVLSGHIVPVLISTKEVANIVLLDAGEKYEDLDPHTRCVVDTLWSSRHMVIDPHARLVLPSN